MPPGHRHVARRGDGGGDVLFREHPRVEVVEGLYSALDLPDAHELIRGFAYNQTREAPAWASSAFIALNLLKDPRMCSKMCVFGLTTDDADPKANTGYADDPDKYISPAHDYVLEHDYYKMAVEDDWPGWDNVKYVQMEHPIGSANEREGTRGAGLGDYDDARRDDERFLTKRARRDATYTCETLILKMDGFRAPPRGG